MQNKTDIGMIGLAVMGENLAINMANHGWQVSVYNRTVPGIEEGVVERFMQGRGKGKSSLLYTSKPWRYHERNGKREIRLRYRSGS